MEIIKANQHRECSKRKSENEVSATVLQNKYANLFNQNVQQTHSLNLEAAAGKTSRINMKKNGSDPKATTNDITIAVLAKNLNCRQFGQKQSLHKRNNWKRNNFRIVLGNSPKTMRKLFLSTKLPHQENM